MNDLELSAIVVAVVFGIIGIVRLADIAFGGKDDDR